MHMPVHTHPCTHMPAHTHLPQFFKKLVRYCGSAFFSLLFLFWLDKPLDFFYPFVLYLHFPVFGAKALSDLHRVSVSCPLTEGRHSYKGFFSFPFSAVVVLKPCSMGKIRFVFIIFKYLQYFIRTKQQRGS